MEKPRGRCTPYAFFLNICRDQCEKKGGDKVVDFNALSSICWERWGRMSELEKKRFVQMSDSDQKRLDREMELYNEEKKKQSAEKKTEKMEEKKKKKEEQVAEKRKAVEEKKAEKDAEKRKAQEEKKAAKKKMKKDPGAPKAAKSSYMCFFLEYREQLKVDKPGILFTDMAKEAGKKWKLMSPSERAKWEQKAADDKVRFEREKKAFLSGSQQKLEDLFKKTGMTPSKSSVVATNGNADSSSSDSTSDSESD